jgi:hypothetical protein
LEGPDAIHTPHKWAVEAQNEVLYGVGQWMHESQDNSLRIPQDLSTSVDDVQDTDHELTRLHALAVTTPFGQYFHMRMHEEGALDFEIYSLLS